MLAFIKVFSFILEGGNCFIPAKIKTVLLEDAKFTNIILR